MYADSPDVETSPDVELDVVVEREDVVEDLRRFFLRLETLVDGVRGGYKRGG